MTNEEFQATINALVAERDQLLANQQNDLATIDQLNAQIAAYESGGAYASLQTQLADTADELGRRTQERDEALSQLADANAKLAQIHGISAPPVE